MYSNEVVPVRVRVCLAWSVLTVVSLVSWSGPAWAQFKEADPEGARLGDVSVQRWQAGMIVTADSGPCRGIVGTAPVPTDWPEQEVTVVAEDISPSVRVSYDTVGGTAKQMKVVIPFIPAGREAKALVTLEVRRRSQLAPENTDIYQLPDKRRMEPSVRICLGPSPGIESTSPKIKALAKQIGQDEEKAWNRVEAIYDWVRENVQYDQAYAEAPVRGALAALATKKGDCEDMSSLFIAICRAAGIPARTVWVPGHCYPEFYLVDAEGEGHWFPCQAAGSRAFGEMPDRQLILQKGDNFRPPYNPRERKRYLAEHLTGAGGRPKVHFVRELLPN